MSIYSVAAKADVSTTTVSRYINNSGPISDEIRKRIKKAMLELNYSPREKRPGLKQKAIGEQNELMIGFLVISGNSIPRNGGVFSELLAGIQKEVQSNQASLMMFHYDCDNPEAPIPSELFSDKLDGMLVYGSSPGLENSRLLAALKKKNLVWTFRMHNDPETFFDHVFYDNNPIGRMAAEYLLQRGHRDVVCFASECNNDAFCHRRDTFKETFEAAGGKVRVCESSSVRTQGENTLVKQMHEVFNRPERPSAIFGITDNIIYNAYMVMDFYGIRPMVDIDCIGVDNNPVLLASMNPRPATIDIKVQSVGELAVTQLFRRIKDQKMDTTEIAVRPKLIPAPMLFKKNNSYNA